MLEKYLQAGINYNRTEDTLELGLGLAKQAEMDKTNFDSEIIQKTKKNVENIISEYKKIHVGSSLWATKQTKLMEELRKTIKPVQPGSDESEIDESMRLRYT
ncbi:hypothetical protein [Legionella cherrii]|uniref:Uncharacterized protein n=1 Tax=Legionella cherrii TaxID=28084 RepID=A0A0W0S719_9GAMM|nr:hypothetical protein [Legionella cherrii]KTC78907.1 hypothetical protein Lche_0927 [Legionella cherrii]VEB36158.1 Uncharacterised protein [Legionella cherrii]